MTQHMKEKTTMIKKTVCTLCAVFACMVAGNVVAADTHPLMGLDTNQDGFVSLEEAEALPEVAEAFATLDTNKDGKLDIKELAALKG